MSDDPRVADMHADLTAAVRSTGGTSSEAIAEAIVAAGWVKPAIIPTGEQAYDDLSEIAAGHVIADTDNRLYRKQKDGTWTVLRDTPGATTTLVPGDLAFDAPFLVVIQPKD